jgi:hypothetical protein
MGLARNHRTGFECNQVKSETDFFCAKGDENGDLQI